MQGQESPIAGFIIIALMIYGIYWLLTRKKRAQKKAEQQLHLQIKTENSHDDVQIALERFAYYADGILKSKTQATALKSYHTAQESLQELISAYPHRDDWRVLLQDFEKQGKRDLQTVLNGFINKQIEKTKIVKSIPSKITSLNKAQLELSDAIESDLYDDAWIERQQEKLEQLVHSIELNKLIETAEKHEFKEEYKKALSCYQDALFYLKKDAIDDNEQEQQISMLEEKIARLKNL